MMRIKTGKNKLLYAAKRCSNQRYKQNPSMQTWDKKSFNWMNIFNNHLWQSYDKYSNQGIL